MEKKLIINRTSVGDQIILTVSGRLDANWAGYLDDKLIALIEEGKYHVGLNLRDVVFLSSAGIRILVKQQKAFHTISGELSIVEFSENVRTVLDMVGMIAIFTPSVKPPQPVTTKKIESIVSNGYHFTKSKTGDQSKLNLIKSGSPEKIKNGSFSKDDNQLLRFENPFFGLGIGAFGEDYNDCNDRYGEFIALGSGIALLPSNNTKTPDYMVKTGKLVPEINTLYYLGVEEGFQNEFRYNPDTNTSIGLGQIIETVAEMGNHKNFAFLMFAESAGLIGTNLNASPVSGKNLFQFPEIREQVNFTTEPAHMRALTVVFGIVANNPSKELEQFIRPLNKQVKGHVHAAIFPYTPLQKEDINYDATIHTLFNNSEVIDVMHLLNDNRDINGLGESLFKSGHCWTTEIDI
ncbi:MAG: STAS domain-containing protein [Prolixibacteraceae bacterium]|jgi:anti-anti-sigma factor|nr:STAS domain-containing protein [Prolixibacteraceae bacterium]